MTLIQTLTRSILIAAAAASLLTLGGCYETVTYSRPFPGMQATGPTAHDYSKVQMVKQGSDFDPLGAIFRPVASVARGIGEVGSALGRGINSAVSGGNKNAANNSGAAITRTSQPARPAAPSDSGGPRNSRGRSLFDTNPDDE